MSASISLVFWFPFFWIYTQRWDCWIFSSVQSLGRVQLLATPWVVACQASLSITISRSSLKLMSIELVMPSNHLNLCCPFLLLLTIFPSIRISSNDPGSLEFNKNLYYESESRSVMSKSLQPHGLQHARLPCPSPSPGVCSNLCPLSQWWERT